MSARLRSPITRFLGRTYSMRILISLSLSLALRNIESIFDVPGAVEFESNSGCREEMNLTPKDSRRWIHNLAPQQISASTYTEH